MCVLISHVINLYVAQLLIYIGHEKENVTFFICKEVIDSKLIYLEM